jgi:hypothetical protein
VPAVVAAAVVAILLIVLLVRGCGDDTLSAEQLRAQAGAICAATTRATDRIAVPNEPAGGARFLGEAVAELRPALVRLRALKPPQELSADYDRALRLAAREVALIWRHQQLIERGEDTIATFRALQRALGPVVVVENETWRALDVEACVRR